MVIVTEHAQQPLEGEMLRGMLEARKQVFVDLLKWDVPVVDGRFELDQFDDPHCAYLIVTNEAGDHLGSARLLQTIRPHILDTLFPELVAGTVPKGPQILEITRFCLSRNQNASERLETRNRLVTALVAYALANDVHTYTGVAELSWLQQILAFGWRCRPLGLPRHYGSALLGALLIDITEETPALLHQGRIWTPETLVQTNVLEAA
jgi:N-acyl-L-homoserine lactone synthetase